MRKRTPAPRAPRSDCVTANGTWLEELPEEESFQDQVVLVVFMTTDEPRAGRE